MVGEGLWRPLIGNLNDPKSQDQAQATLRSLLEREGENAAAIAVMLAALIVQDVTTPRGKELALGLLSPFASNVPEVSGLAITMSQEEEVAVRKAAANVLVQVTTSAKVRDRILQLISDPDADIRINVMAAVSKMEFEGGTADPRAALRVIPDEDNREEAIRLLDELESAVKMLQDIGLAEGQDLVVDDLILPRIAELRQLFKGASVDVEHVVEQRKHGLLTLGTVTGSAKALALGTAAVANADEAAQTVANAAEGLFSVVDMLGGLL